MQNDMSKTAPATDGPIRLVVVGAHLSGMPLNHELASLGAELVRADTTAPVYRLFALPEGKPGLLRVTAGGAAISVELWTLSAAAFGRFVNAIPAPLSIGKVQLSDGSAESGFLVEHAAIVTARDITSFGGWREFRQTLQIA
ncbi:allophanate hydrolase-related protein [Ancylobacter gelatini]|uniref:allophanate hydrolase-related protein n=1 Tax=Ancylobacter gelatini TaxID=2919920 RepID=UPI00315A2614